VVELVIGHMNVKSSTAVLQCARAFEDVAMRVSFVLSDVPDFRPRALGKVEVPLLLASHNRQGRCRKH
jgi:hypothetical protein